MITTFKTLSNRAKRPELATRPVPRPPGRAPTVFIQRRIIRLDFLAPSKSQIRIAGDFCVAHFALREFSQSDVAFDDVGWFGGSESSSI